MGGLLLIGAPGTHRMPYLRLAWHVHRMMVNVYFHSHYVLRS